MFAYFTPKTPRNCLLNSTPLVLHNNLKCKTSDELKQIKSYYSNFLKDFSLSLSQGAYWENIKFNLV